MSHYTDSQMSSIIAAYPLLSHLYSLGLMIMSIAFLAMLTAVCLVLILPALVSSSGEGNIHLLENEVSNALRSCSYNESTPTRSDGSNRRSRSNSNNYRVQYKSKIPRIDNTLNDNMNLYGHETRNATNQMYVLNGTENSIPNYGIADTNVKYVRTATMPAKNAYNYSLGNLTRWKRSGYLMNKSDDDQCLSQCVFANLQVVDERGIPREAELWNKVQTALTSQQSRTVLKDQIRTCFQELQSEDEDNGCSYSNKLERCLMLRFSDRKWKTKT